MDKLRIRGGRPLAGRVRVSGAKNAVLPALAASLLTDGTLTLRRVPDLRDLRTMLKVLEHLGAEASLEEGSICRIRMGSLQEPEAPYDMVRTMRASILVLGPLLARFGRARVSLPGGCAIGERPVDLHITALRALGADVDLSHGYIDARARKLTGAEITFSQKTVTGTENALMAASLARGNTVLRNCAGEPEVSDLAALLSSMGARIRGAGTETVEIEGVDSLHGAEHTVIPDRIEAATFAIAGILSGGEVTVEDCDPSHLAAPLAHLQESGAQIECAERSIRVHGSPDLEGLDLATAPYPGFPTDLQAQVMAAMTQARGKTVITEAIFENRFMHVGEMRRMGAEIELEGRQAVVQGPRRLSGAQVMATDLRASASLVLAALVADGITEIHRVYHLDRGYAKIESKLSSLGAEIERVST
jgi:UDP-N-acetylglucosamine 1-carboxyvinyltransferase